MKQFILPKIAPGSSVAAVYKMSFDGGYFYIGGSSNIKRRMWSWKYKLNSGVKKNILVTAAFEKSDTVVFEILEIIEDVALVKTKEDFYIKSFWSDKRLLNRSNNAFDNSGLRLTKEQLIRKPIYKTACKKVAKFNKGGELLGIFESRTAAAAEIGVSVDRIKRCLKKYGLTVYGYIYKDVGIDGSFIEAPVAFKRKTGRKKGSKHSDEAKVRMSIAQQKRVAAGDYKQPEHSKPMVKYDLNGSVLSTFPSIGAAAKSMGANVKNFKKLLKKGRIGYYKGFIWEHA